MGGAQSGPVGYSMLSNGDLVRIAGGSQLGSFQCSHSHSSKKSKETGKNNFNNTFKLTQYVQILSFQHAVNIKIITEIFYFLFLVLSL